MLSIIYMHKNNCITKDQVLIDYQTNEELETRDDLSVGEDLETLKKRILNKEMTRELIPERGELKGHFLICLLDEIESLRLESQDKEYLTTYWDDERGGPYIFFPLGEWNKSKSDLKFAKSVSWRATYVIDRSPLQISNTDKHPQIS